MDAINMLTMLAPSKYSFGCICGHVALVLVHVHECKHHPNAHETGSAYVQSIIKELETMADSHASIRILRLIPIMFWRQDHYYRDSRVIARRGGCNTSDCTGQKQKEKE